MAIADAAGLPVAAHVESASPHEVKLAQATVDKCFTGEAPEKLIGDKAYDSDQLDRQLLDERGVEMIAPHRSNRSKPRTQDGRKLRRYRRRWKVERLFASRFPRPRTLSASACSNSRLFERGFT